MRPAMRLLFATVLTLTVGAAAVFTATQNYLPKYAAGGSLVDSVVYESVGRIGIGTANPDAVLHAHASSADNAATNLLHLSVEHGTNRNAVFSMGRNGFPAGDYSTKLTSRMSSVPTYGSTFQIQTHSATTGAFNAGMFMDNAGNTGVGTTNPTAKLHVAGDVKVDGNIAAKYQDVAEWVPARGRVAYGTVVVIGGDETNVVRASVRSYDSAVAGVVSPQPGIALGEEGAGKVLVAHAGRVRVKVDASYGAVETGDLLVTSPTRGFAMRSEPLDVGGAKFHRPGTPLGKALEALPSGQGEILVLLTLQ